VALCATIIATLMTLPVLVQSFSRTMTTAKPDFSSLPWTLMNAAVLIGTASLLLALVAAAIELWRRSHRGRILATGAIGVAILGAFATAQVMLAWP
jgi:hypothetical protein